MLAPSLIKKCKIILIAVLAVLFIGYVSVLIINEIVEPFSGIAWDIHEKKAIERGVPRIQIAENQSSFKATYNHIPSWRIGEYTNYMSGYERVVFAHYFRKKIFGISVYHVPSELKPGDDLLRYCSDDSFCRYIYNSENLDHINVAEPLIKEFNLTGEDAEKIRNRVKYPHFTLGI